MALAENYSQQSGGATVKLFGAALVDGKIKRSFGLLRNGWQCLTQEAEESLRCGKLNSPGCCGAVASLRTGRPTNVVPHESQPVFDVVC